MLRVLLLALFSGASAQLLCTPKETEAISKCYQTYMAGFNITMTDKHLPEYWIFHNTRMDWLNRDGLDAQPTICTLGNALIACLKPYPCLGPATLEVELGLANVTEANDYWIDLSLTVYQCGVGYPILMSDFYCIGTCRDKHQADLDACTAAVEKNIVLKGACKAEQILLNCQSNIFTNCCDWNAGVFFCNNILCGINALQPECYKEGKVSCPNPKSLVEILKNPALRMMRP